MIKFDKVLERFEKIEDYLREHKYFTKNEYVSLDIACVLIEEQEEAKMKILELIFLFLVVWWTLINVTKLFGGERIPSLNFIFQTIGIIGVIACRFYFQNG